MSLLAQKSTELELEVPNGMRVEKTDGKFSWIQTRAKVESSKGPTYTAEDSTLDIGPTESLYAISPECGGNVEGPVANVGNLLTTLTGAGAVPRTLAEFFPTVLDDLDIELPEKIDNATAASVLNAVAGISRGRDRTPRLHLVGPSDRSPESPFRRRVAFIKGGAAQLRLRNPRSGQRFPVLEVRGSGDGLVSSGRLAGKQQLIAFSVPAVHISPDLSYETRKESTDVFTFNEVASGRLEVEMNTPATLSWAIHQADLGGHVQSMRITVVGRTQSVGQDLPLQVRMLLDGRPVGVTKLEGGGPFEIEAEVPFKDRSFSLRRESTLRIEARVIGQKARTTLTGCEPGQAVSVTIDGDASTVRASLGTSKLQGLYRFPQAIAGGITVRLGNDRAEELVGSARVIGSLWTGRAKTFNPEIIVEPISGRTEPNPKSKKLTRVQILDPSSAAKDVPGVTLDGIGGVSSDVFNDATLASRTEKARDNLEVSIGDENAPLEDVLNVSSFSGLDGDLAVVSNGLVKAVWTSRSPQTGSVATESKPPPGPKTSFSRFRSMLVGIVMSMTLVLVLTTIRTVVRAARHLFRRPRRIQS